MVFSWKLVWKYVSIDQVVMERLQNSKIEDTHLLSWDKRAQGEITDGLEWSEYYFLLALFNMLYNIAYIY